MQIAILGRQAGISLAELEALYGAVAITPVEDYAVLVNTDTPLPQSRLGGTMKSATVLKRLENTELIGAFEYLQTFLPEHFMYLPKGKLQFGVSIYGFKAQRDWLLKRLLTLKKIIKKTGQSVRIIENKSEALEAAQILYNKLTSEMGCELLLIADGNDVIIAQTTAVQDIDAYSERDFGRPLRDAFVGMLPPKLAQIMINLASVSYESRVMSQEEKSEVTHDSSLIPHDSHDTVVLDPFCGTGVVLQEALLMGYGAYGTDLSEKMVDYSQGNLRWLETEYTSHARHSDDNEESRSFDAAQDDTPSPKLRSAGKLQWNVEHGDATSFQWDKSKIQDLRYKISIATETYLGQPLTSLPHKNKLDEIMAEANQIAEGFLKNIAPQIKSGTRLCVALPAWAINDQRTTTHGQRFLHLKMLDHLEDMGYNRLEFVHAKKSELIYHRTDQIVARELTILTRI